MTGPAMSGIAEPWPAWRGPEGNGICHEEKLPLRWSTNHNVRWCVPLPDRGNSTPVVWEGSVFITQALEGEHRLTVMICRGCVYQTTYRGAEQLERGNQPAGRLANLERVNWLCP